MTALPFWEKPVPFSMATGAAVPAGSCAFAGSAAGVCAAAGFPVLPEVLEGFPAPVLLPLLPVLPLLLVLPEDCFLQSQSAGQWVLCCSGVGLGAGVSFS